MARNQSKCFFWYISTLWSYRAKIITSKHNKSKAAFMTSWNVAGLGNTTSSLFFTGFFTALSCSQCSKYTLGTVIISVLRSLSGCASSSEACQKVSIALQVLSELLLKGSRGGAPRGSFSVIYAHQITQMGCQGLNPFDQSVSQSVTVVLMWSYNPERKASLFGWKFFTGRWQRERGNMKGGTARERAASKEVKYWQEVHQRRAKSQ